MAEKCPNCSNGKMLTVTNRFVNELDYLECITCGYRLYPNPEPAKEDSE